MLPILNTPFMLIVKQLHPVYMILNKGILWQEYIYIYKTLLILLKSINSVSFQYFLMYLFSIFLIKWGVHIIKVCERTCICPLLNYFWVIIWGILLVQKSSVWENLCSSWGVLNVSFLGTSGKPLNECLSVLLPELVLSMWSLRPQPALSFCDVDSHKAY